MSDKHYTSLLAVQVPAVEDANSSTRVVLDELPLRYRRRPLEDLEINYINVSTDES